MVNRFVCQRDPARKLGPNKIDVRSDSYADSPYCVARQIGSKRRNCPWITRASTLISLQAK